MSTFPKHSPGAEEAGLLALELLDDLFSLLRQRGVLSPDDIAALLEGTANRLSQSPNAFSKRGSKFIRDAMLSREN